MKKQTIKGFINNYMEKSKYNCQDFIGKLGESNIDVMYIVVYRVDSSDDLNFLIIYSSRRFD